MALPTQKDFLNAINEIELKKNKNKNKPKSSSKKDFDYIGEMYKARDRYDKEQQRKSAIPDAKDAVDNVVKNNDKIAADMQQLNVMNLFKKQKQAEDAITKKIVDLTDPGFENTPSTIRKTYSQQLNDLIETGRLKVDDDTVQDILTLTNTEDDWEWYQWFGDAYSRMQQNRNLAEAKDFAGRKIRADEYNDVMLEYLDAELNKKRSDAVNNFLNTVDAISEGKLGDVNNSSTLMYAAISKLRAVYPEFKNMDVGLMYSAAYNWKQNNKSADYLYSRAIDNVDHMGNGSLPYVSNLYRKLGAWLHEDDYLKAAEMASNRDADYNLQNMIGDDVEELNRHLYGFRDMSEQQRHDAISRVQQEKKKRELVWDQGIRQNVREAAEYEANVSQGFIDRENRAKDDFYSWSNLLYKLPGQLGFSMSSWRQLALGLVLSIGASAATGFSTLLATGLSAGSLASGLNAGVSENNNEITENFQQNLKDELEKKGLYQDFIKEGRKYLGSEKDESEILEQFGYGNWHTTNRNIQNAIISSRFGSNKLFDEDMMAVAGDETAGFFLNLIPMGKISKSGKIGFKKRLISSTKESLLSVKEDLMIPSVNPNSRAGKVLDYIGNIAKEGAEGAAKGFEKGSTVSGLGGGTAAGAAVGSYRATKAAITPGVKALAETKAGLVLASKTQRGILAMKDFGKRIADTEVGRKTLRNAKYAEILAERNARKLGNTIKGIKNPYIRGAGRLGKYGLKRGIPGMISEGIEEGKQYLNAKEWMDNEGEERFSSLLDNLTDDIMSSARTSYIALGAPLGLELTNDHELYANIVGGELGGFGHLIMLSSVPSIYSTIKDINMDKLVQNNIAMEKLNAQDSYQKGKVYARAGLSDIGRLAESFDNFINVNKSRKAAGREYIPIEAIEEQKKYALQVAKNAASPIYKIAAKKNGIKVGSNEYIDWVSALTFQEDRNNTDSKALSQAKTEAQKLAENTVQQRILSEWERHGVNDAYESEDEGLIDKALNRVKSFVKDEMSIFNRFRKEEQVFDDNGKPVFDEKGKRKIEKVDVDEQEARVMLFKTLAEIHALQQLINDYETLNNHTGRSRDREYVIILAKKKLNELSKRLSDEHKNEVLNDVKAYVNPDEQQAFDDLSRIHRDMFLYDMDIDSNNRMIEKLAGKKVEREGILDENGNKTYDFVQSKHKPILDKMNQTWDDDNNVIELLDELFLKEWIQQQRGSESLSEALSVKEEGLVLVEQLQELLNEVLPEEAIQSTYEASDDDTGYVQPSVQLDNEQKESLRKDNKVDKVFDSPEKAKKQKGVKKGFKFIIHGFTSISDKQQGMNGLHRKLTVTRVSKDGKILDAYDQNGIPVMINGQLTTLYQQQVYLQNQKNKTSEQQKTIAKIDKIRLDSDRRKDQHKSTYHDYFIKDDEGKEVLYINSEYIIGELYAFNASTVALYNEIKRTLNADFNSGDMQSFSNHVKHYSEQWNANVGYINGQKLRLAQYVMYLQKNPNESAQVIEAIAKLASVLHETFGLTVSAIGHQMAQCFFSTEAKDIARLNYNQFTVTFGTKTIAAKDYMTREVWDKAIKSLERVKKQYDDNGFVIISKPVTLFNTFRRSDGQLVHVASTPDLIAVDQDGKIHIIDIRTSKYSFETFKGDINGIECVVKSKFESVDDLDIDGKKTMLRTDKLHTAMNLSVQLKLMQEELPGDIAESPIEVLPIAVIYREDVPTIPEPDQSVIVSIENEESVGRYTDIDIDDDTFNMFSSKEGKQSKIDYINQKYRQAYDLWNKLNLAYQTLLQSADQNTKNKLGVISLRLGYVTQTMNGILVSLDTSNQMLDKYVSDIDIVLQELDQIQSDLDLIERDSNPINNNSKNALPSGTSSTDINQSYTSDIVDENNPAKYLRNVITAKDFTKNGVFELIVDNGVIYMQITYNGHTYSRIRVFTSNSEEGRLWESKVFNLWNNKKEGEHVYATNLSRTRGLVVMDTDKDGQYIQYNFFDTGLMSRDKMYDISTEADQFLFGLVRPNGSGGSEVVAQGRSSSTRTRIYTPTNGDSLYNGTYVFILDSDNDNHNKSLSQQYPLMLLPSFFLSGSNTSNLDFLYNHFANDWIINPDLNYEVQYQTESLEGGTITKSSNLPITYRDIISLFIPYGKATAANGGLHITREGNNVIFTNSRRGLVYVVKSFDVTTEDGKRNFREFLSKTKFVINKDFVDKRLNEMPRFKELKTFFKKHPEVQKVQIENTSIIFDPSDFKDPNNPNDKKGLSGLGWLLKRQLMYTSYGGIKDCLIGAEDVAISSESGSVSENIDDSPQTTGPIDQSLIDMAELDLTRKAGISNKKLDPEKAKKQLRKLIGDVPVEIADRVIAVVQNSKAWVVGRMTANGITLSRYAEEGDQFHEAFHWIIELAAPKFIRKSAYKAARKIMQNQNIEDNNNVAVAEFLAERYKRFNLQIGDIQLKGSIKGLINYVTQFVKAINDIGSTRLRLLFLAANTGVFSKAKISDQDILDFEKRFPRKGLNAVSNSSKYDNCIDKKMYRTAIRSIAFLIVKACKIDALRNNMEDLITDESVLDMKLNDGLTVRETLLGAANKNGIRKGNEVGINLMRELIDDWSSVEEDVRDYLSELSTNYTVKYELENDENKDSDEYGMNNADGIEEHVKASYEFSKFQSTTAKIRFLFSMIEKRTVKVVNGVQSRVLDTNELGYGEFYDAKEVFNVILNDLHNVTGKADLIKEIENRATYDLMYLYIHKTLVNYVNQGHDADVQQVLTQLVNTIKSNKNNFRLCEAKRGSDSLYTIRIIDANQDYEARNYREEWSMLLANGATPIVEVDESGKFVLKKNGQLMLQSIFNRIINIRDEFNSAHINRMQKGKENPTLRLKTPEKGDHIVDINTFEGIEEVKSEIIKCFNRIGIQFNKGAFNYMLDRKYKDHGIVGLEMFFAESGFGDISGLWSGDNNIIKVDKATGQWVLNIDGEGNVYQKNPNGNIIHVSIDKIYNNNSFVSELSKCYYEYRHSHDELTVLATKGNKFYVISDNNLVSDVTLDLNINGSHVDKLMRFAYAYQPGNTTEDDEENPGIGSIIVKKCLERRRLNQERLERIAKKQANGERLGYEDLVDPYEPIQVNTISGFKTNEKDDEGSDYFEMTEREDFVTKATILQLGYITFPTLSDKKTWMFLSGVKLPGIDYDAAKLDDMNIPMFRQDGGIVFSVDAIDLLIEYCTCEYDSALKVLEDIKNMPDDQKVKNYHSGPKVDGNRLANGATLASLTGIYVNGKYISFTRAKNENGEFVSLRENLNKAFEEFFSKDKESQREIIRETLSHGYQQEFLRYIELGIVSKDIQNGQYVGVKNVGLDKTRIKRVEDYIKLTNPGMTATQIHSAALRIVIADTYIKGIISIEEVERVYSGHPGFFKYKYDEDGKLVDRQVDEFKRFGGLGSTGVNNDLELYFDDDLKERCPHWFNSEGEFIGDYSAAEVEDHMVLSRQIDYISELVEYGAWLRAYENWCNDKNIPIEELSVEEMQKAITDDRVKTIVKKNIKEVVDSYKKSKDDDLEGINVADGSAYISDDMCEMLLRMCGGWNSEVKRAFEILRSANSTSDIKSVAKAYQKVITTVIGTLKYTAYGMRESEYDGGKTCIPYYNKMALFPVFKCIAHGDMQAMYKLMHEQNVDMVLFNSAVKIGSQNPQPWTKDIQYTKYRQPFKYLRKQLNTDPKEGHDERSLGTQMSKVVFAGLSKSRTYVVDSNEMTGKLIVDKIMQHINKLSDIGVKNLEKKLFNHDENGDRTDLNIEKFSKFLKDNLTSRDADDNILDAISVVEGEDGKPRLKMNLAATSNVAWLESVLNSRINSEVIDINTPGTAFVQRSIFGMEGESLSVEGDKEFAGALNGGKPLQMINEEGSMDCVLSIDFFYPLLKSVKVGTSRLEIATDRFGRKIQKKGLDGKPLFKEELVTTEEVKYGVRTIKKVVKRTPIYEMREVQRTMMEASFEEQVNFLRNNGLIGGKSQIIGYRIPTQAQSSIHALRCVDVLPAVRDTVILPEEFTKTTGSDFDIDKLYLATLNYKSFEHKDENGHKVSSDITEKEDASKYHQNELIKTYIEVLKDVDPKTGKPRSADIHNRSIDNDTKLPKDIADEFDKLENDNKSSEVMPFQFYTLSNQSGTKNNYITGKIGIGPYALNNNNHILTSLYEVEFSENTFICKLGYGSLHRNTDDEGNSIQSWISALINAHVDIAKDPWISRLNVNPFTYNISNLMIRTGFGSKTFYFLKLPIVVEMAKAYMNAQGSFMKDPYKSKYQQQEEAVQLVYETMIPETIRKDVDRLFAKDPVTGKTIGNLVNIFLRLMLPLTDEDGNVTGKSKLELAAKGLILSKDEMLRIQAQIFYIFKELDINAKLLADIVKYSKIDTKKQGKTIAEQLVFYRGVLDTFIGDASENFYGLTEMYYDSYICKKTENAISLFKDILSSQLFEASNNISDIANNIYLLAGHGISLPNEKFLRNAYNSIITYIQFDFWNQYAQTNGIDIKSLFSGNNTVADRINRIKVKLFSDDKLRQKYLIDDEIRNPFLRLIIKESKEFKSDNSQEEFLSLKFVRLFNLLDISSSNRDLIIEGWNDLLNDTSNDEIQKLARDMVVYAAVTSGNYSGSSKLFKFVPNDFRTNISKFGNDNIIVTYVDHIKLWLETMNDRYYFDRLLNMMYEDVLLNNYEDNKFVPLVRIIRPDNSVVYNVIKDKHNRTSSPIMLIDVDAEVVNDPKGKLGDFTHPLFIKTKSKDQINGSLMNYTIYKRFMYYIDDNNIKRPIYVKCNPKGVKFGSYNVYEYGDCGYQSTAYMPDVDKLINYIQSVVRISQTNELLNELLAQQGLLDLSNIISKFIDFETESTKVDFSHRLRLWNNYYEEINDPTLNPESNDEIVTIDKEKVQQAINDYRDFIKLENGEVASENEDFAKKTSTNLARKAKLSSALEYIINTSPNQPYVDIARMLLPYVKNRDISINMDPVNKMGENTSGNTDVDVYPSKIEQKVEVFTGTELYKQHPEQTILHECVHSLTSATHHVLFETGNNEKQDPIEQYILYVKELLRLVDPEFIDGNNGDGSVYGLTSSREFIAEAFSNPKFLGLLKSIPAMEQLRFDNMFEEFVNWVKNIISRITGTPQNAYDQIMPYLQSIIDLLDKIDFNSPVAQLYGLNFTVDEDNVQSLLTKIIITEKEKEIIKSNIKTQEQAKQFLINATKLQTPSLSEIFRKVKLVNAAFGTNYSCKKIDGKGILIIDTTKKFVLNKSEKSTEKKIEKAQNKDIKLTSEKGVYTIPLDDRDNLSKLSDSILSDQKGESFDFSDIRGYNHINNLKEGLRIAGERYMKNCKL